MADYELVYYAKRGRGEQIRLLLEELEQPYDDANIDRARLQELQAEGPGTLYFGSVPMLAEGTLRLSQGPAIMNYLARKHGMSPADPQLDARAEAMVLGAEDIRMQYFRLFGPGAADKQKAWVAEKWRARWLPALEGLLESNGSTGYFVGDSLTQADIAMFDAIDAVLQWVEGATLDGYPLLSAHYEMVKGRPRIAAYLGSDRRANG